MSLLLFAAMILVVATLFALATGSAQQTRNPYSIIVGSHRFDFEFAPLTDGTLRLYVLKQPGYGTRNASLPVTHRYQEGNRYYVCIQDHLAPKNYSEACDWAQYWAVKTTYYIATGRPFA
jgi:hypothetical protein